MIIKDSSARFFASGRVEDIPSIVSKSQFIKQFRAMTGNLFLLK